MLSGVVSRLRISNAATPSLARPCVFGDLKPEHVIFPPGENRPVFIDPGLMRGRLCADPAKLLSRLVLGLVARQPAGDDVRTVIEAVRTHTAETTGLLSAADESAWIRQLLVLWLMDTTNILTTYLANPEGLPLSPHGAAVAARAGAVCRMLDQSSAALTARHSARDTWQLCLSQAAQAMAL
ncbi:hypothetical protein ACIREO_28180 [Streptomyces sp. NPDC102441]|uniref:hypothetical protein n=1 Tax=Streptomyces sp. NPDC102441 TaxID=3366176 RepID=UPI00380D7E10